MTLRVGDTVIFRKDFSNDTRKASVIGMQIVNRPFDKQGQPVKEADWDTILDKRVLVILDNGCWVYGNQIMPVDKTNVS